DAGRPTYNNRIENLVVGQERLAVAEGQIVSSAEVEDLPDIEGTGEIIQMRIAQREITSGAVVEGIRIQAAAACRCFAAPAIEAGSRASLHIVFKGVRPGVVGIELHSMIEALAELGLQRVVVGVPHISHFEDALPRGERIYLEEVDGVIAGGWNADGVASAEAGDHGAEIAGVAGERIGEGSRLSLLEIGDELAVGVVRIQAGCSEGGIENRSGLRSLKCCASRCSEIGLR